jgi:hypothetical protein
MKILALAGTLMEVALESKRLCVLIVANDYGPQGSETRKKG